MAKIILPRNLSAASDSVTATQGPAGGQAWLTANQTQLVPLEYDFIDVTYDGTITDQINSVVYKTGGSGGLTVATLALTYDTNGNIKTVTRS